MDEDAGGVTMSGLRSLTEESAPPVAAAIEVSTSFTDDNAPCKLVHFNAMAAEWEKEEEEEEEVDEGDQQEKTKLALAIDCCMQYSVKTSVFILHFLFFPS